MQNTVYDEEYEKGEQAGRISAKMEIAKNLLKLGIEPNKISEATNLTIDEIEELSKK